MYCTKCGKEIKDGGNFCSSCGANLVPVSRENILMGSEENKLKRIIKCGNCEYIGPGQPARRLISIILAWLCVVFAPLITILYFVATSKYRCPKCRSNFVGIKNNEGVYVSQKKSGTLFILLIAIGAVVLIGLISTLAIVSLNNARTKARDAKRISDIKQIQTVLELHYADRVNYPNSLNELKEYLGNIPSNPKPNDGNCGPNFEYKYIPAINKLSYELEYCLGGNIGGINAGLNIAWPGGITKNK